MLYFNKKEEKKGAAMKRKLHVFIAIILAVALLTACGSTDGNPQDDEHSPVELTPKTDIVIGTTGLSGVFSPFFTESSGDSEVMSLINIPLLTLDRQGEVVMNSILGETREYNGTDYSYGGIADILINQSDDNTVFNFHLRRDIFFSDGEKLTADDLIFTLYVLCDPDFNPFNQLAAFSSLPISGLDFYRTDANRSTFMRYRDIAERALEMGMDFYEENEHLTPEQHTAFYRCYTEAWLSHVKAIVDYCKKNYADYSEIIGEGDIQSDSGLQVALAMFMWRIADFELIAPATDEADAIFGNFTSISGRQWDLSNNFPTVEEFFREFHDLYNGDLAAYIEAERISGYDDPVREAVRLFIKKSAAEDPENTGMSSILGIRKIDDYEVEVALSGQIPQSVYSFLIPVAPLHHYGDLSLYDYENNNFGFPRGDLSIIREKSFQPLGAGPYTLIEHSGRSVFMQANQYYYKGIPQTANINFTETSPDDFIYGAASGVLDIAAVSATRENADELKAYSAAFAGGVWRQSAAHGGLGYIGINAERVNVFDPEEQELLAEESINFRKGLAVIFAAYREITVFDFFGEAAVVAELPVSGVSWISPRTAGGYKTAYGVTFDGNNIYSSDMTEARRLDAARRAALDYFEAAGCELNVARTAISRFPEGMRNDFEIYITGGGAGRHPSHLLLTMAADALRAIGINITIKDVSSQGEMFEAVINGTADMWCAAFTGGILPELSKRFSTGAPENFFRISADIVDLRITLAEASLNPDLYLSALDAVLDNAVCIPVYQRQIFYVFSSVLDPAAVEADLTVHYNIADIIWKMRLEV